MANGQQSLKNGSLIGQYSILRLIGKGGMGEVYEALDQNLHRKVALKVVNPQFAKDTTITSRFEQEGRTLAKVSHKNLVLIYAFGRQDDIYYIAMEYIDGRSIGEIVKTKRFTPREAIPLFIQMLDGIHYLHQSGIIHRDLKSQNIILRNDSTIKVVDFGIAKNFMDEATDLTQVGEFIGSAHYTSPEMASGRPASSQSDIFSLGVIFYEMLVGKRPFGGSSILEVLDNVKNQPLKFPPDSKVSIPEDLKKLILEMCEKEMIFRASDISELQRNLALIHEREFPLEDSAPKGHAVTNDPEDRTEISNNKLLEKVEATRTSPSEITRSIPSSAVRVSSSSGSRSYAVPVASSPGNSRVEPVGSFVEMVKPQRFRWMGNLRARVVISAVCLGLLFWGMRSQHSENGSGLTEIKMIMPARDAKVWIDEGKSNTAFSWTSERKGPWRLQVSTDKDFQTLVVDVPVKASPYFTPKLRGESTYHWRLIEQSSGEKSPPSTFYALNSKGPDLVQPTTDLALATGETSMVTKFTWTPKVLAGTYRLQVARDETFTRMVSDVTADSVSRDDIDLMPGKYFWRVRAEGRDKSFDQWSLTATFSVLPPAQQKVTSRPIEPVRRPVLRNAEPIAKLEAPQISRPRLSLVLEDEAPKMTWENVGGAMRYQVEVSTTATFQTKQVDATVDGEEYTWDAATPGSYYWRVRALGKSSASPYSVVAALDLTLNAPTINANFNKAIKAKGGRSLASATPTAFSIQWQAVARAHKYKVIVAEDPGFQRPVQTLDTAETGTEVQLPKPGLYYLRVAAMNERGQLVSPYSQSTLRLEQAGGLEKPTIKAPRDGAIVLAAGESTPIVFLWAPVAEAQFYEIQFSSDANFTRPFYTTQVATPRFIYSGAFPKDSLFWRVRANSSRSPASEWTRPYRLQQRE